MDTTSVDLVVIGSGPAGEKAALEAAGLGARTVIVERGNRPGGASVVSGTLPSKSIRESVQYLNSLSQKDISGISPSLDQKISIRELMHRRNRVTTERSKDMLKNYQDSGVQYIKGSARFISSHEIEVDNDAGGIRVHADKYIIAVGTKPYHPADIEFDHDKIRDSDSILELETIPETVAVYGGGVIGCEYASIFSNLDCPVHLIDPRGTLLDFVDHELSIRLASDFRSSGIDLHLGETYQTVRIKDDKVEIVTKSGKVITTSALLYANGRQGVADELKLETCGLKLNNRNQLEVNQFYQTEVPHIYAAGDIIGYPSLVSTANEEGRLAAKHALGEDITYQLNQLIPCGIYTMPEIAMIGPTENELRDKNVPYESGVCDFKNLARGLIIGERTGMLKLLFDPINRKVLSVHILGVAAAELVHIGQSVIAHGGTLDFFIEHVFNFPTLASAYKVAARDGLSKLKGDDQYPSRS